MIHWPFLVKQPFHSLCVYTPTLTGMMSLSLSYLDIHHTDPGSVRGYFLVNGRSSFSLLPSASFVVVVCGLVRFSPCYCRGSYLKVRSTSRILL